MSHINNIAAPLLPHERNYQSNNNSDEKRPKGRRKSTRSINKLLPPDIEQLYKEGALTLPQATKLAKEGRQHCDTIKKANLEVIDLTNEEDSDEDTTVSLSNTSLNKTKDEVVANGTGSAVSTFRDMEDDNINNTDNNDSAFNRTYYIFSMDRWWEGSASILENGKVRIKFTNNTLYTYRTTADYIADIKEYKSQGRLKWKDEVNNEEKQQLSKLAIQKERKKKSIKKAKINTSTVRKIEKQWKPTCREGEQCKICLDYGSDYSLKGCGHVFHWQCIQTEIQTDRPKQKNENMHCCQKCPICRNPILGTTRRRAGDSYTPRWQREETNIDEDAIIRYTKEAKMQRDLIVARRQGSRARKKAKARVIQALSDDSDSSDSSNDGGGSIIDDEEGSHHNFNCSQVSKKRGQLNTTSFPGRPPVSDKENIGLKIAANGSSSNLTAQNKYAQQGSTRRFDALLNVVVKQRQTEDKDRTKRKRQEMEDEKIRIAQRERKKTTSFFI
jgi:hypothetical protein